MPIRQVYTYCTEHGCRYGCILTTEEAFVFRIRPREEVDNDVKRGLIDDGLLEYKSIPWKRGTPASAIQEEPLTVNLALVIIHVLAGNAHAVDWKYGELQKEKPNPTPCEPLTAPRSRASSMESLRNEPRGTADGSEMSSVRRPSREQLLDSIAEQEGAGSLLEATMAAGSKRSRELSSINLSEDEGSYPSSKINRRFEGDVSVHNSFDQRLGDSFQVFTLPQPQTLI